VPEYAVGEISLFAETSGSGDPLVLIGGTSFDSTFWALHMPWLSERRTVIAFDNRDVGRSTYVDRDYTPADMAVDTYALVWAMGFDRVDVLGYSLGGAVAQELALAHPEAVRSLILYGTWASTDPWLAAKFDLFERLAGADDQMLFMHAGLMDMFTHRLIGTPGLLEQLAATVAANPWPQKREGLVRQWRADKAHDARDRVGSIACPTLVLGNEEDVLVPIRYSKELAELIPGATLEIIPEAGHGALIERADEFQRIVSAFLEDVTANA
jgi:3-oxoadipate enol-lactonase